MANSRLDIEVTTNGTAGVVKRDLESVGKAGAAAGTQAAAGIKRVGVEATAAGYAVRSMNHTIAALAVGAVIGEFARLADEWQNIHNKLLNVTGSTQNLNAVNEALFEGAQKSRIEFGEFVNIYQELAIQAKRFGTSQQQMVDITTTMTQAAQLAHPSLAMMKMGVEQLILTMERGRMTTRAFSALLKDTPQLAKALADGLGIGMNQLRELAHHSALTASQMIEALEKVGPKVAEEFARLTPTFHNSMVVLHNGWVKFIGDLDSSTGILGGLTSIIIALSHHVDILAFAVVSFGSIALATFAGVAKRAIIAMWAALVSAGPVAWAIAAILSIAAALAIFGDKVAVTSDGFVSLLDTVKGVFATIGQYIQAVVAVIQPYLMAMWDPMAQGAVDTSGAVAGVLIAILEGVKGFVNGVLGLLRFMFDAAVIIWSHLETEAVDKNSSLYNTINMLNNKWMNNILSSLDFVAKGWQKYAEISANAQNATNLPGAPKVAPPKKQSLLDEIGSAAKRDFGTDYLGNFANNVRINARQYAKVRHSQTGLGMLGTDHGEAEDDPLTGKKTHPSRSLSRQEMIDAEMRKYGDQTADANNLDNTYMNRKAFEEVTKFNDELQKHKDKKGNFFPPMTAEEKAALYQSVMALEDANRVQKERDTILEAAIGPQRKYGDQLIAIDQLLGKHQITLEQATRAERDAAIAFLDTKFDAASGKMKGTLEILKEMDDKAHPLAEAMKGIWSAQEGPLRTFQTQMEAVNALLEQQLITAKEAAKASRDAAISYLDTQTDAASGVTRALLKIQKTAEDSAGRMEQVITDAFQGMEDAWVALMTGGKFDPKSFLKTIQTDLAKDSFQKLITPIAGFLQSKFGIALPGLMGKIGESRGNPMWVRNADAMLPGQGGAGDIGGGDPLNGLMDLLGVGSANGPLNDTHAMDESFNRFTGGLGDQLETVKADWGTMLGGAAQLFGQVLASAVGGSAGGILGTIIQVGGSIAMAYFGQNGFGGGGGSGSGGGSSTGGSYGGYATGGAFTVGGSGGVDSQLVQFKASPGEHVSVGQDDGSKGGTVNYYDVHVDARGASELNIEERVARSIHAALPAAEKRTRQGAVRDVAKLSRRQQLTGGR